MEENTNVCNMPEKATIEIHQSKETGKFYLNFICWNNRGYDGIWLNSKEEISPEVVNVIYDFLEACANVPVEEEVDEEFCLTGKEE